MITLLLPMHHDPSNQTIQSDEPNSLSDSLHSQMETAENQDCAITQPDYITNDVDYTNPSDIYNSIEAGQNQNNIDGINDCFQQDIDNYDTKFADAQPVADNIGNQGMADSGNADASNLNLDNSVENQNHINLHSTVTHTGTVYHQHYWRNPDPYYYGGTDAD
ncbi:hypothetical protein QUF75_13215 [Desulfococcaceae bacterium HSG7]|nr:hypothetical protein [Desulfococcaceae bacterium HSG7]